MTNDVPILLDSGANMSFISLEFAKRQSLPLTDINSFPVYLVNSSKEPSFWVSKKTKWTFHFSNFPSFKWDLTVLDAPGMDDTILGHDFL
ncbi:aspartyl protease family protein, partial [Puccinia sorghi]